MRRGKHETNSTFLHHYYSGTDVRTVLQGVSKRLPQNRKGETYGHFHSRRYLVSLG